MSQIETLVYLVVPLLVLVLGLVGNVLGFLVVSSKRLALLGPIIILKGLFISDTVYLLQIIMNLVKSAFDLEFVQNNNFTCKTYCYVSFSTAAPSPWILCYFLIDRLLTIKYSKKILRNKKVQLAFIFILVSFNLVYYIPMAIFIDIIFQNSIQNSTNSSNTQGFCIFTDSAAQLVLPIMDSINLVIIPFFIMVSCSLTLGYFLFKANRSLKSNLSQKEHKNFIRNMRLSITSISLNFVFMALNFPLNFNQNISLINNSDNLLFYFFLYWFYASYSINFYIFFITNNFFRQSFMDIFRTENNMSSNTRSKNWHSRITG